MGMRGNPYGYEPGFTVDQHRDELIQRLGAAMLRIKQLEAKIDAMTAERDGIVAAIKALE